MDEMIIYMYCLFKLLLFRRKKEGRKAHEMAEKAKKLRGIR